VCSTRILSRGSCLAWPPASTRSDRAAPSLRPNVARRRSPTNVWRLWPIVTQPTMGRWETFREFWFRSGCHESVISLRIPNKGAKKLLMLSVNVDLPEENLFFFTDFDSNYLNEKRGFACTERRCRALN
jgi:hypothetical protein